jgi:hypothetical protein
MFAITVTVNGMNKWYIMSRRHNVGNVVTITRQAKHMLMNKVQNGRRNYKIK